MDIVSNFNGSSNMDTSTEELRDAVLSCDVDLARTAINNGADVNYQIERAPGDNRLDSTFVMTAAFGGNLRMMKLLVDNGADIHRQNNHGETALILSAMTGAPSIITVQYLLEREADVNVRDNDGTSALYHAVSMHMFDRVAMLLSVPGINIDGADIDLDDEKLDTDAVPEREKLTSDDEDIQILLNDAEQGIFPSAADFGLRKPVQAELSFVDRISPELDISR